jgi:DNA-binding transcriptional LysR family regulator
MQDVNWNDLRLFLAVATHGSFVAAAHSVGQHETTVARAVRRAERDLGQALLLRPSCKVTAFGRAVSAMLAPAETAVEAVRHMAGQRRSPTGSVVISAVGWVVTSVLVPCLPSLQRVAPRVTLTFRATEAPDNLISGEADIALRFAGPTTGGRVLARRLATVRFVLCAPEKDIWIGYDRPLPQADWIDGEIGLRVGGLDAACAAVKAGVGKAHLPLCLVPPGMATRDGAWTRDMWLMRHPDRASDAAITAVLAWMENDVARRLQGLAPQPPTAL